MAVAPQQQQPGILLRFGGGTNLRELPQDLQPSEDAGGQNFNLDVDSAAFFRRKPFDLVGVAPNAGDVRGFAQLSKSDGTITTLIQAGSQVYAWDGSSSGFTSVGTVDAAARLRGNLDANFASLNKVLITDLQLKQPVMSWDGTSFIQHVHNLGGLFYAKYCHVSGERAWFANVQSGAPTPHMLVASAVDDPAILSVANRPSSSLGLADPFYLLTPDLSPINGYVDAFKTEVISTQKGNLYVIAGTSAQDYSLKQLYQLVGAVGDESIAWIGNDAAYGRNGRIETLFGVLSYGDVESQELSRHIAPSISDVTQWTLVYDRRLYRLYAFPQGKSDLWVFYKSIVDDMLRRYYRQGAPSATTSPWAKWSTGHAIGFQPSTAWTMRRPGDGLWCVYMGDASGNVYQMEGNGGQDGGSAPLTAVRLSKLFELPDGNFTSISGYIRYQKWFPATVRIQIEAGGTALFDQFVDITLDAAQGGALWGGGSYWGGGAYYGLRFAGRVAQQPFSIAGRASLAQVRVTVTGTTDFFINEIGFKFNVDP